jgi:hypothetical protein
MKSTIDNLGYLAYLLSLMLPLGKYLLFLHRSVFQSLAIFKSKLAGLLFPNVLKLVFPSTLLLFDFVVSKVVARSQEFHRILDIEIKVSLSTEYLWKLALGSFRLVFGDL